MSCAMSEDFLRLTRKWPEGTAVTALRNIDAASRKKHRSAYRRINQRFLKQETNCPTNAVHLQGIEPACAGGCLTANRKSPLEGGWFLKGETSGSLSKFVGSARKKM